jgi:hypothetical protein
LNHVFAAGVVPPARVSPLSAITVLELIWDDRSSPNGRPIRSLL